MDRENVLNLYLTLAWVLLLMMACYDADEKAQIYAWDVCCFAGFWAHGQLRVRYAMEKFLREMEEMKRIGLHGSFSQKSARSAAKFQPPLPIEKYDFSCTRSARKQPESQPKVATNKEYIRNIKAPMKIAGAVSLAERRRTLRDMRVAGYAMAKATLMRRKKMVICIVLAVLLVILALMGFYLASFSMNGKRQTLEEAQAGK